MYDRESPRPHANRARAGAGDTGGMDDSSLPFDDILAGCLDYMRREHGDEHAHRLFFELYNAMFLYLDRELGPDAVDRYWEHIGAGGLERLYELVAEHGIAGLQRFWEEVASEEGARFEFGLTNDEFRLTTTHCPPTRWLEQAPVEAYGRYPLHCKMLYGTVAERLGYDFEYQPPSADGRTCCRFTFRRQSADGQPDVEQ